MQEVGGGIPFFRGTDRSPDGRTIRQPASQNSGTARYDLAAPQAAQVQPVMVLEVSLKVVRYLAQQPREGQEFG
jgi:hypothetical protein